MRRIFVALFAVLIVFYLGLTIEEYFQVPETYVTIGTIIVGILVGLYTLGFFRRRY